MCLPEGTRHRFHMADYGDGITRERYLPAGTPMEEAHTTTPLCEVWRDASGNQIDSPANHETEYALRPMVDPPTPE